MKKAVSDYFARTFTALSVVGLISGLACSQGVSALPLALNHASQDGTGSELSQAATSEVTVQSISETEQQTKMSVPKNASATLHSLLAGMKQFRARFEQTVLDAQQTVVHEAQGMLTMTRPDKLRWETTFPDETLLIADGEAVWNVDSFVEQVTVLSQENAIKDNPIVLLTSRDEQTWNKFAIAQLNAEVGPNLRSFQVTPKELGGQIVTLTLTFNQDDQLAAMNMLDAQQQISTLVFSDIETRFPLAADTFTVDIPDSYIVDDQR